MPVRSKCIDIFEVKSFEVDSSHMPLCCQVKSSQVEYDQVDGGRLVVDFSLTSGHVSVPQRLAGLRYLACYTLNIGFNLSEGILNETADSMLTETIHV